MKIVKCVKCGKYMHQSGKCCYCGNLQEFETVSEPAIHENVAAEYRQVQELIEHRQFSEAKALSYTLTEWMAKTPDVFWLRLLAKHECASDMELVKKGFDCKNDTDMQNALKFSKGAEHTFYLEIQNLIEAARTAFQNKIMERELECKAETGILQYGKEMQEALNKGKEKLFELWQKLDETEQALYCLELDCAMKAEEYKNLIIQADRDASKMLRKVSEMEECQEEDFYRYKVKLGSILWCLEHGKAALEEMESQDSWGNDFLKLKETWDRQLQKFEKEFSDFKTNKKKLRNKLGEIAGIENRHRKVCHAVEAYHFGAAEELLGRESFHKVFRELGINTEM